MIHVCVRVSMFGENKLQRLKEVIFDNPHFIGFNYYQGYRIFLDYDETEDYVTELSDMEFQLSMGARKAAMFTILAMVKGDKCNFSFNLSYSEFLNAKTLYPEAENTAQLAP